jgi:protein-tyrosine-phosphatase
VDAAGRPFLLEINGRLWGSLALALHAGVDFPLAMLRAAQNPQALSEPPAYPDGLRCRHVFPGELHYLRSVLSAPSGELGKSAKAAAVAEFLLLFLDPRMRYDYLWWSDPLPGVAQAAATSLHLLRKQLGRPLGLLRERRPRAQWRRLLDRGLAPPPALDQRPVLFLCHGNICRSPFAAAYFNQQLVARGLFWPTAQSAGFVSPGGRRTPALLRGLSPVWGVELCAHRSQVASRELLASASALFVMDGQNYQELLALDPAAAERAYALGAFLGQKAGLRDCEIADPYETSPGQSHAVYQQLAAAVDAVLTSWGSR